MKKFFIVFIALAIGVGGGYFLYKHFYGLGSTNVKTNKSKTLSEFTDKDFKWGVTMGPSDLNNYSLDVWNKQIKTAVNLGIGWIRLRYDSENKDPFQRNDEEINTLQKNGLNVVLIIEQDIRDKGGDDYKDGYSDGNTIATHYKGKIKYYQMINEGGGESIKQPTLNGQDASQFDEEKYKKLTNYLKGVSDGIYAADPSAWRIVNMGWTHVGYLDKLAKDKINFDMIGIDWYGWMGDIGTKKLDNGQLLVDKLKSYNKPLIFMEVNADSKGKIVYENKQAEFIKQIGTWAYQNKDYVKGFFVLSLFDGVNNASDDAEYFGIVKAKQNSGGVNVPGDPRKSFYAYQDLIKQYLGQ